MDRYVGFNCKIKLQHCWSECVCVCVFLFRILVVKQTRDVLPPLNNSSQSNVTLVDLVIRSILPASPHLLSAQEVADAIETRLQTTGDIWPSWTVRLKALFTRICLKTILFYLSELKLKYPDSVNTGILFISKVELNTNLGVCAI